MTDNEYQDTLTTNASDDDGYEKGKRVATRKGTLSRQCTWSQGAQLPIAERSNGPVLPVILQVVTTLSALAGQVFS
jgi:hypothetical protein